MMTFNFRLLLLCSVMWCMLFGGSLFAQSSSRGLTSRDVANIEQVNEIAIAPSGEKAIYTLRVQADPFKENEMARYELYLADLTSGNSLPYVTTMSVSDIAFRPQHQTITFLAGNDVKNKQSLYEIAMTGGEAQLLFSFPESILDYEWAPDGKKLAFMADDTVTEEESPLPYQPEIYGENLKQRRGFVTSLSEKANQVQQLKVEGSLYQMHWSPDGQELAIAVAPTPRVDDYFMHQKVMLVNARGVVIKEINHEGKQGAIKWSPDGQKLAMLAGGDIHDPIAGRLFVVPADSGNPTQLQPNFDGQFEDFTWTNDSTLHYLSSQSAWSTYGRIHSDGTGLTTIIDKDSSTNLTNFERASGGATIFTVESAHHPPELYQLQFNSRELSRITNSNPWLDSLKLGKQEVVSWTARDGTELEGILVYPLDYVKGKLYPLITTVHGGPESHYDNGWITSYADPGQVAATQGYFVFYPNYRGSTGRGEAFAKSSQGDMAGAEFDDIVAGVNELIKVGIADSSKIGVTGGSYGGYATGWFATRYTEVFDAGVMFVGVSDNISKWGTSDIPEELYLVHARERIWEDYDLFLKRSPIYYAGKTKTPLLIMAGKEDTRVDPSQSYELYRHIKTRTETPVRLVLYPGEGHGNASSTARLDYNLRMMRWFNNYLKQNKNIKPKRELEIEPAKLKN